MKWLVPIFDNGKAIAPQIVTKARITSWRLVNVFNAKPVTA